MTQQRVNSTFRAWGVLLLFALACMLCLSACASNSQNASEDLGHTEASSPSQEAPEAAKEAVNAEKAENADEKPQEKAEATEAKEQFYLPHIEDEPLWAGEPKSPKNFYELWDNALRAFNEEKYTEDFIPHYTDGRMAQFAFELPINWEFSHSTGVDSYPYGESAIGIHFTRGDSDYAVIYEHYCGSNIAEQIWQDIQPSTVKRVTDAKVTSPKYGSLILGQCIDNPNADNFIQLLPQAYVEDKYAFEFLSDLGKGFAYDDMNWVSVLLYAYRGKVDLNDPDVQDALELMRSMRRVDPIAYRSKIIDRQASPRGQALELMRQDALNAYASSISEKQRDLSSVIFIKREEDQSQLFNVGVKHPEKWMVYNNKIVSLSSDYAVIVDSDAEKSSPEALADYTLSEIKAANFKQEAGDEFKVVLCKHKDGKSAEIQLVSDETLKLMQSQDASKEAKLKDYEETRKDAGISVYVVNTNPNKELILDLNDKNLQEAISIMASIKKIDSYEFDAIVEDMSSYEHESNVALSYGYKPTAFTGKAIAYGKSNPSLIMDLDFDKGVYVSYRDGILWDYGNFLTYEEASEIMYNVEGYGKSTLIFTSKSTGLSAYLKARGNGFFVRSFGYDEEYSRLSDGVFVIVPEN
ncbi:MAG: hypothetical protein Q4E22_02260 [Coriobacteriia bacterium]|nr:hypothetical protein [Coriobacteriia bacterium]